MRKSWRNSAESQFSRFARNSATAMGHPVAFAIAMAIILLWALSGPFFGLSDTWQLVINTGTTIVTFLMVFLIQNTQNRDSCAIQIKLDELIRSTQGAHNALLNLEELPQEELDQFLKVYHKLSEDARRQVRAGLSDSGTQGRRTSKQPILSVIKLGRKANQRKGLEIGDWLSTWNMRLRRRCSTP